MILKRPPQTRSETLGFFYGFLGVLCFSLTLPATRAAVADLHPTIVGLGRAIIAAGLAAALLFITRQPRPQRRHMWGLVWVVTGVIVGFPVLSAFALRQLPASHGAILIGILPLTTAIIGSLRTGDRPSGAFWLAAIIGSGAVIAFAFIQGAGALHWADWVLLVAVIIGALGYVEGARLARELGGWQVISWGLLFGAPLLLVPFGLAIRQYGLAASPSAWLGFGYVSIFSQFLGFFAWYHGLVLGGVARVSQIQLLQPFLTILAAALLLGEQITPLLVITALIVCAAVALGKKAPIARPALSAKRQVQSAHSTH